MHLTLIWVKPIMISFSPPSTLRSLCHRRRRPWVCWGRLGRPLEDLALAGGRAGLWRTWVWWGVRVASGGPGTGGGPGRPLEALPVLLQALKSAAQVLHGAGLGRHIRTRFYVTGVSKVRLNSYITSPGEPFFTFGIQVGHLGKRLKRQK